MGHTIYCPTVQLTWNSFKDKPEHKIECHFDQETQVTQHVWDARYHEVG